jgi:division/cell wall cluster transcriptional repressor MraZ
MLLGGLLCLLGIFLTCKLRDGNRVSAQGDARTTPSSQPVMPLLPLDSAEKAPEPAPPPQPPLPPLKQGPLASQPVMPESAGPIPTPPPPMPEKKPNAVSPVIHVETPTAATAPASPHDGPATPTPAPGEVSPATRSELTAAPPNPLTTPPPPPPSPNGLTQAMPAPVVVTPPPEIKAVTPSPEIKTVSATTEVKPATPAKPEDEKPVVQEIKQVAPPVENTLPPPSLNVPTPIPPPVIAPVKKDPGEPPLAPQPGPVQMYQVRHGGETLRDIARRTLGSPDRWEDIHKLNPNKSPESPLNEGVWVRLPADACVTTDDVDTVKPLPVPKRNTQVKAKPVLPLTGTFPCNLDDKHTITLPRAIREQLGQDNTVLVSPGPDQCLWLTNHAHLERLAERMDQSQAKEADVRVFKRLYFAQTEKVSVSADCQVVISDRLVQFAGLHQEVVLVGIDDHFELWDIARWRVYTQQKSGTSRPSGMDAE